MRGEGENVAQASTTVADEDLHASQVKPSNSQIDSSATMEFGTAVQTVQPPSAPVSSMGPPALRPPRSGQGTFTPAVQQPQAPTAVKSSERAAQSTQIEPRSSDTIADDDEMSAGSSTPSEPQDRIEDFDWEDLQQRYHDKIDELDQGEQEIFTEFQRLCEYFSIWADTSRTHEVDRSFKRLKTQMTYVQHEEDELEKKRGHYIKVVEAFKSALSLLGN